MPYVDVIRDDIPQFEPAPEQNLMSWHLKLIPISNRYARWWWWYRRFSGCHCHCLFLFFACFIFTVFYDFGWWAEEPNKRSLVGGVGIEDCLFTREEEGGYSTGTGCRPTSSIANRPVKQNHQLPQHGFYVLTNRQANKWKDPCFPPFVLLSWPRCVLYSLRHGNNFRPSISLQVLFKKEKKKRVCAFKFKSIAVKLGGFSLWLPVATVWQTNHQIWLECAYCKCQGSAVSLNKIVFF